MTDLFCLPTLSQSQTVVSEAQLSHGGPLFISNGTETRASKETPSRLNNVSHKNAYRQHLCQLDFFPVPDDFLQCEKHQKLDISGNGVVTLQHHALVSVVFNNKQQ